MAGDGTAFDAKQYDQKMSECAPAALRRSRSLSALKPRRRRLSHAARVYRGSRTRWRTRLNEAEGDDMISDWTEVAETFDSMGLHENLLRGIYAYGAPPPAHAARGADAAPRRTSRRATHAAAGLTLWAGCVQALRSPRRSSSAASCRSAAATTSSSRPSPALARLRRSAPAFCTRWVVQAHGAARSRRARAFAHPHACAHQLDYSLMETQALVLGPTRELAQQIEKARSPPLPGTRAARKP